ncbi:MAG: metallophosphoesterase [Candidatus Acetothermia bacterium]|jgi:predicted MPP superfamily phosphohydrolase|nr:metallophosphoesterase [Candidatus Acetothermia bacterium]MDH7504939.1 metallophosphoesterase [Candidatus Acetothermia bacterium]
MRKLFILALLLALVGGTAGAEHIITGTVFHDANLNGVPDSGESGLEGVLVSDGKEIVATAADGSFSFALGAGSRIVFVSIPSGWWTDQFYRHIEEARFAATGTSLDFPLYPIPIAQEFTFIQVTDIHIIPQAKTAVEEFVARANGLGPDFVVSTGDLVFDVCYYTNLADTLEEVEAAFTLYREATSGLASPLFHAIGNHDCACALDPSLPEYYKGAYQKHFGPLWYSFDFGEWHFIVLDGNSPEPLPTNWLSEEELAWLGQDLALQPKDRPILLFSHQPLFLCRNYDKLLELVRGYNVKAALAGHEHATYTREAGITNIVTGALSGRWWGDDGVHWNGSNPDGSPQGFRLCRINGEEFSSEYLSMK